MPRVLYVGDVPVEATYHGSLLLFRLFEGYSSDKTTIVETGRPSEPSRRLRDVSYMSLPLTNSRWLNTRFHPHMMAWYSYASSRLNRPVSAALSGVKFDCVITVAHGVGWLTAAAIAERNRVPLHLMVHDDWPRVADVPAAFRKWLDASFGRVYKQASSRLCVSPMMRKRYFEQYGCDGEVIYPARATNCLSSDGVPVRSLEANKPFTVAFAGTINTPGYIQALRRLRDAVASVNGKLAIFGPLTQEDARLNHLDGPNVLLNGLVESSELLKRLREEADALFVPMSFSPEDRSNMEMAFPSKLADYTAVGLPLLIYGPEYCSAVSWARENDGVAEIIVREDCDLLNETIRRLAQEADYRVKLGERALEVGQRYFASDVAQRVFKDIFAIEC
jgi:glycosyltransferase involved in cell wall biosynthesis